MPAELLAIQSASAAATSPAAWSTMVSATIVSRLQSVDGSTLTLTGIDVQSGTCTLTIAAPTAVPSSIAIDITGSAIADRGVVTITVKDGAGANYATVSDVADFLSGYTEGLTVSYAGGTPNIASPWSLVLECEGNTGNISSELSFDAITVVAEVPTGGGGGGGGSSTGAGLHPIAAGILMGGF